MQTARAGFDAVQGDPQNAQLWLADVIGDATAPPPAKVLALWGLGRLMHNAGSFEQAVAHFERAASLADESGLAHDAAGVRVSSAVTFQTLGNVDRALRELDLAEPFVAHDAVGRWAGQRALVLLNLGRPLDAIRDFDRAVGHLIDIDDRTALARTHLNRAVAHLQRNANTPARADLVRAHELAMGTGEHLIAAGALHNLGYLDGRLGQFPAALRSFEQARATYLRLGSPGRLLAALDVDHCDVLLAVGLAPEAIEIADRLIHDLADTGDMLLLGEVRLMRTRALAMLGNFEAAAAEATAAEQLLRSNDRHSWATVAAYLRVVASAQLSSSTRRVDGANLDDLARSLDSYGWRAEAAEVRTMHGRVAIEEGDLDEARRQLSMASRATRGSSVDVRAHASFARALIHLADGNPRAATLAAKRGLDAVNDRRASFGSSELRIATSAVGVPLVEIGLRIALDSARPSAVLRWAERGRAVSMTTPANASATDPDLVAALTELRQLHRTREHSPSADPQIAELERRILRQRRLDPGAATDRARAASASSLRTHLNGAALVEYVECDGQMHAVVVDRHRSRLVSLGSTHDIVSATDHLLFAIRRLSVLPVDEPRLAGAVRALERGAEAVEQLLLAPLKLSRGMPLVIVPTGRLHLIPWTALATVRTRPTTLTPSAARWSQGASRPAHDAQRVVLVAGPNLQHSATEMEQLADLYLNATMVSGPAATVARTLQLLEGAELVHIAAHGLFRSDSPMFSSLQLADGPLSIHDLESLRHPPQTVVLTACDAGRSVVFAGDELLGTATALLAVGVNTVVAPILPVSDQASASFAVALHRKLAAGNTSPADALAALSREAHAVGDGPAIALTCSFRCIGTRESRSLVSRVDIAAL